jgi:hypothetical protein
MSMDQPLPGKPAKRFGRAFKRGMGMLAILVVIALALTVLAAWLIHRLGPVDAVRTVHESMRTLRPFALAVQLAAIGLVWWFWLPLVRWAKFAPTVEAAWLAVRNRLALWALGLIGLMWIPTLIMAIRSSVR